MQCRLWEKKVGTGYNSWGWGCSVDCEIVGKRDCVGLGKVENKWREKENSEKNTTKRQNIFLFI